jgi:large subunit ribosomal protein L24e
LGGKHKMPRCSFCKQNYEIPRGLTLILNDGNILYFCSGKCRKNQLFLKRDNKKVNWVRKSEVSETVEKKE